MHLFPPMLIHCSCCFLLSVILVFATKRVCSNLIQRRFHRDMRSVKYAHEQIDLFSEQFFSFHKDEDKETKKGGKSANNESQPKQNYPLFSKVPYPPQMTLLPIVQECYFILCSQAKFLSLCSQDTNTTADQGVSSGGATRSDEKSPLASVKTPCVCFSKFTLLPKIALYIAPFPHFTSDKLMGGNSKKKGVEVSTVLKPIRLRLKRIQSKLLWSRAFNQMQIITACRMHKKRPGSKQNWLS